MGVSKLLWFFPFKMHIGTPVGNGIDWFVKEDLKANITPNISQINDGLKDSTRVFSKRDNNDAV